MSGMDLISAIFDRCKSDPVSGCLEWQLATTGHGYPVITHKRVQYSCHREVLRHKLGGDLKHYALHTCDNRRCCNPDHLYEGTVVDNARDRQKRGRGKGMFVSGAEHPSAKLTQDQVMAIRAVPHECNVALKLAAQYGVSSTTIKNIRLGKQWKASIEAVELV